MPLTKMFARFFLWAFNSLDAIPVYRGNPHALIKTFRMTIDAMQAGDNLLIFPERGDREAAGVRGYAEGGIGDLYTGFAMLAPALYHKTRKSRRIHSNLRLQEAENADVWPKRGIQSRRARQR